MQRQPLIPPTDKPLDLNDYDANYTADHERSGAKAGLKSLQDRMKDLQDRLYAEGKQSLLIMLQAMDAGGKDGTIKRVFEGVNPQGVHVANFKAPTAEELDHDFLWRIHQETPRRGMIGIFNRSQYEDVLIVRVNQLVPKAIWQNRYDHINNFERLLAESGTRILKFYLHIDKKEQKERFQKRLGKPDKNWKFNVGDLPVREKWNDYMAAYTDAISRCNTDYAPWYIIPANHKWYRNLIICRTIVETLEDMNPQYPPPEPGLADVVIPD
jgi:PPK2 family polyphosphate:nucleotide phosphotransferase